MREFRSPIHRDNKGGKSKKIKGKSKGKNAKLKAVRTRVSSQINEVKLFDQNRGQRVSRRKEKKRKITFLKICLCSTKAHGLFQLAVILSALLLPPSCWGSS